MFSDLINNTTFIIAVTSVISIIAFNNRELFDKLKFNAYMVAYKKEYGRMFSNALSHGSWVHLGVNMFVLWQFGTVIEKAFQSEVLFEHTATYGRFLYFLMYLMAIPIASLPSLLKHKNNHYYNSIGASGAVSAVVFSFILIFPNARMGIIFIPLKLPAVVLGTIYLVYSYIMSKQTRDNIAHEAHFAGAIFGIIFPLILNYKLLFRFIDIIF